MTLATLLVLVSATLAAGQRPSFAGSRPIGYPVVTTTEGLGDRFGEVDGTTQRLPIEANGDRELVDRLSKLPIDQQPFWLINWQALEANRQKPQTYPQRPNVFVDSIPTNGVNSTLKSTTSGENLDSGVNSNLRSITSGESLDSGVTSNLENTTSGKNVDSGNLKSTTSSSASAGASNGNANANDNSSSSSNESKSEDEKVASGND